MPYFCYIHNGLFVNGDVDGCHDEYCLEFKERDIPPVGVCFTGVPGGSTVLATKRDNEKKFNKDMHAYREAVRQGLNPEQVTKEAAITAEKIANSDQGEHSRYVGVN